ncbi:MAG: trehalose-phosphatase [Candidatus Omnitrophica bacterium]|nr:trehalose-phosphatase [Candidatus Omnitrophota bacterium]MDD5429350.1 trehalose-phosphatase [Candidatus Omnitrophota bacterium]
MKYFFSQDLNKLFKNARRVFLLLDYDGTLAPIVKNPSLAKMPPVIKKKLECLLKRKKILIGIISGRSLKDVREKTGVKNLFFAGSHGAEIFFRGKKFIIPKIAKGSSGKLLGIVKRRIKTAFKRFPGVIYEDKPFTFSIHYRNMTFSQARRVVKEVKDNVSDVRRAGGLRLKYGKKVIEVVPRVSFGKFDAVKFFYKKINKKNNDITVFVGDDLTDEDIFKNLDRRDIGIRVGKSKLSAAEYFLKNTSEVGKFLDFVSKLDL